MKSQLRYIYLLLFVSYSFIFIKVIDNLRYRFLWYDEASQFWTSKGLFTFDFPLMQEGSIIDVFNMNKYATFEPPGFAILLHFWSKISNEPFWLRLLPFIFFIITVVSIIYLSYRWINKLHIALMMGIMPFFIPVLLHMSTEIRPYAMEMLSCILCILGANSIREKLTSRNLLFWTLVFSFFLLSRYSAFIVTSITSLYVCYLIANANIQLKEKLLKLSIYSLPLITSALLIISFVLKYQNTGLGQMNYLKYLSNDFSFLIKSINLFYVGLLILSLFLLTKRNKWEFSKKYEHVIFICSFSNLAFFILSLLGFHPWDPTNNRSISMILLMVVFMVAIMSEIIHLISIKLNHVAYPLFIFFILTSTTFLRKGSLVTRYGNSTEFSLLSLDFKKYPKIYVDLWVAPYVRYLFEYGKLKNNTSANYPNQFAFNIDRRFIKSKDRVKENSKNWEDDLPTMNKLTQYDMIIGPKTYNKGDNDKWHLMPNTTDFYIKKLDN